MLALPCEGTWGADELDQQLRKLGLASCAIPDTSLKEVWMLREDCQEEVVLGRRRSLFIYSREPQGGGHVDV